MITSLGSEIFGMLTLVRVILPGRSRTIASCVVKSVMLNGVSLSSRQYEYVFLVCMDIFMYIFIQFSILF